MAISGHKRWVVGCTVIRYTRPPFDWPFKRPMQSAQNRLWAQNGESGFLLGVLVLVLYFCCFFFPLFSFLKEERWGEESEEEDEEDEIEEDDVEEGEEDGDAREKDREKNWGGWRPEEGQEGTAGESAKTTKPALKKFAQRKVRVHLSNERKQRLGCLFFLLLLRRGSVASVEGLHWRHK